MQGQNTKYLKPGKEVSDKTLQYEKIKDNIPEYLGITEDEWHNLDKDLKFIGLYSTTDYWKPQKQICDGPGRFLRDWITFIKNDIKRMAKIKAEYEKTEDSLIKHINKLEELIKQVSLNRYDRACEQKMDILNKLKKQKENNNDVR